MESEYFRTCAFLHLTLLATISSKEMQDEVQSHPRLDVCIIDGQAKKYLSMRHVKREQKGHG